MNDDELPEWYQMLALLFRELSIYDREFYAETLAAIVLAQARQAAVREMETTLTATSPG